MKSTLKSAFFAIACYTIAATQTFAFETRGNEVADLPILHPSASHGHAHSYDNSILTVEVGSSVRTVKSYNNSTINLFGGEIRPRHSSVYSYDSSTINFSKGSISVPFVANNQSTINVSGGTVTSLSAKDSSQININGGRISRLTNLSSNTKTNISGGSVASFTNYRGDLALSAGSIREATNYGGTFDISGGNITNYLTANGDATLRFYAQHFGDLDAKAGQTLNFDDFDFSKTNTMNLTFSDGSTTSFDFKAGTSGTNRWTGSLQLVAVPEPSTTIASVLGLGVFAVLAYRRKKSAQTN